MVQTNIPKFLTIREPLQPVFCRNIISALWQSGMNSPEFMLGHVSRSTIPFWSKNSTETARR